MAEGEGRDEDDDFLSEIAAGDRTTFGRLMERHATAMLALAERVTGSPEDADEIVQDAFLKVWNMAPDWRPDGPARFSTWLYRVVLNAGIDRQRQRRHAPLDEAAEFADTAPGGLEQSMARQQRDTVTAALLDLPDRQRSALSLYYFSEIRAHEAAKILGVSLSAMEALLVRGKRALRNALGRRGITEWGDV